MVLGGREPAGPRSLNESPAAAWVPDVTAVRSGPQISVVVCSRNGERSLPLVLSRLQRQCLDPGAYEIVVVDDGSDDHTADVAESAGARVVRLDPPVGLAVARNTGVDAARAAIVAFTDDDCEPEPDWLRAILDAFRDPQVDGVGGRVVPACQNRFLRGYLCARNPLEPLGVEILASSTAGHRLRLYLRRLVSSGQGLNAGAQLYSVVGANMAFRIDLIHALGGFDAAIRFGGEEEDLCLRAHERFGGAQLRYEPSAVVTHHFSPSLRDPLRRARAYGRGHPYAVRKHRQMAVIVYPLPVLLGWLTSAAIRRRAPGRLALTAMLVAAAYPRWPLQAIKTRSLQPLGYAYLELAEEISTMAGELQGLLALRRRGG